MFLRKWFLFSDSFIDVTVNKRLLSELFMNSFSNYLVGFFYVFC